MTGKKLKKLRTDAGLTQLQLSKKLDIERATVGRWESTGKISKVYQKILTEFFNKLNQ